MKKIILLCYTSLISTNLYSQLTPDKETYYNPIEKTDYKTDNGFMIYQNGKEISTNSKGEKETKLESVILLSSDKDLKESSSIEDIRLIINKTNEIFDELFKKSSKPGKIMVQFELTKKKKNIQYAIRDDLDLEIMKIFEKRVNAEEYPKSKRNPIKFQLIYKVNSYND